MEIEPQYEFIEIEEFSVTFRADLLKNYDEYSFIVKLIDEDYDE